MTKIKFCGLTRPADIEVANALAADYIGFVFAPNSRRYVTPARAAELRRMLRPGTVAVGVFVNEKIETVAAFAEDGIIDMIQLHGGGSEDDIKELRARVKCPIIRAFRVTGEADILAAEQSTADYVLLDAGNGGTGTVFDWRLAEALRRPYFLAGGLTVDNVAAAVRTCRPFAVDVSSGIETEGVKDADKMRAFAVAVRKE